MAQVRDGPGLGGAAGVLPGQEARRGRGGREARRLDAAGAHHRVSAAQTRHLRGGTRVTSHVHVCDGNVFAVGDGQEQRPTLDPCSEVRPPPPPGQILSHGCKLQVSKQLNL